VWQIAPVTKQQVALVEAGDGVVEADEVADGEAGRDAGRRPPSSAVMTPSQSIYAIGVPSLGWPRSRRGG
jgi:hypothetical protein